MQVAKNINDIYVGIGEYKIAGQHQRLVTMGLGSCVGVGLWDPLVKIGGLLHVMLPSSRDFTKINKPEKYADLGIPLVVGDMLRLGAAQGRIVAKLVGGAQMFTGAGAKHLFNIGERNIMMSRQILKDMSIKIAGEDVGGNKGRTMYLDTDTGEVMIRTIGQSIKVI